MRLLYINNYRGFHETIIPLQKVNFLVGENSTGKTSILKLIKLISDSDFKYNLDFFSSVVDLGRFEDIVNKNNSIGDYFEIGFTVTHGLDSGEKSDNDPDQKITFCKFKFSEIADKITATEMMILTDAFEILLVYNDNKYSHAKKVSDFTSIFAENSVATNFSNWCIKPSNLSNRKKFKTGDHNLYSESDSVNIVKPFRFVLQDVFFDLMDTVNSKAKKLGIKSSWDKYYFSFLMHDFMPAVKWIAPIRAEPKRIYEYVEIKESIDGSHAPQALRDILESKGISDFKIFIDNFGKKSRLFDEIKIHKFGKGKYAPFEIQVVLEGKAYALSNVGYGVSQVLPLLLEIFDNKTKWLAIQQPEVHLHPRAQAEFGELLYNSALKSSKVFLIETHSDFTIDRFRFCAGENLKNNIDSQVLYFNRTNKKNNVEIIPIGNDGSYYDSSQDFRDFFINESIKLLGI